MPRGLFIFLLFISVHANSQGYLKTKGPLIVNEKEEKVILRGMGLGGWMLQEGYMFRLGNLGQQYRIKAKIEELVGPEKTNEFYEQWLLNHTTKADIDSMAAWGFNSIRLPMHFNLYTLPVDKEPVKGEHTWLEKGFALTDSLLKWCARNKMYLILDLHAAPGGQGNDLAISDRDPATPSLWQSEANRQKTVALWKKLAERYVDEPWIGGYDIINEPNWGFEDPVKDIRGIAERKNGPLRALMIDITKAIREVDKKHIIIIEGNGFGNNYHGVLPVWDDNMVLSFHKYGNFNTTEAIRGFLELRNTHNVPLWLGESGENSNTWFAEAIHLVESNDIGWAWWQNKKMGINNPLEIVAPAKYDKLLAYWSGKGEKPDTAEAWSILQQWLQNLKLENNIFHADVVDAMFRQVYSQETRPFRRHIIGDNTVIAAVDFDMGRQGYAYMDKDTASYHYTPGVNTVGNKGRTYRNDGVDIRQWDTNGPVVYNIEDGEWLQYTVTVNKSGLYAVTFRSDGAEGGALSLLLGQQPLISLLPVSGPHSTGPVHSVTKRDIRLPAGTWKLRVRADKGGFIFHSMQFVKQK